MADRPKRRKVEEPGSSPVAVPVLAAASDPAATGTATPTTTGTVAPGTPTGTAAPGTPAAAADASATPVIAGTPQVEPAPTEVAPLSAAKGAVPEVGKKTDEQPSMTFVLTGYLHKDDAEVVTDGLKKLERYWYDSKKNCQQASDLGAPLSIVSTMRKWESNHDVLRAALLCVLHLTYHLPAARTFFIDLGVMEVTANTMRKYPSSEGIHEYGCNLFHNILLGSKGSAKKTKEAATHFVKDLNGLGLVVESMKNFPEKNQFQVQMNACALLGKLATNGFKQQVIHSGAIRAMAPMFDAKPKNKELEKVGKEVMQILFK